jgi:hypothetical protein
MLLMLPRVIHIYALTLNMVFFIAVVCSTDELVGSCAALQVSVKLAETFCDLS